MSADPSQLFYADPTNPQSLNLYGYVNNSPLTHIDPSGMDACAVDLGHGMARITNAADGGGVDCPGNGFYITTDQQVTGVGFNSNGDLSVYGANGSLYNPDGSAYNPPQTISVNGDNGSGFYTGPQAIDSPGTQFVNFTTAPNNGPTLKQLKCGALAGLPGAIDAASLVADFAGPEGQAAKIAVGFGLSLAATFTSAANGDAGGALWGAASFTRAPLEVATKSAGLTGLAQWIPGVGAVGDGIAAIHDISGVSGSYSACMAKQ